MGYWMLNAIDANEQRSKPDPRLVGLSHQNIADTVGDFLCAPPVRIIVSRPPTGQPGYDILPFFLRDARFAALLEHYRVRSRTTFETYELSKPFAASTEHCRNGA